MSSEINLQISARKQSLLGLRIATAFAVLVATGCDRDSPTETRFEGSALEARAPVSSRAAQLREAALRGDNSRSFHSEILRLEGQVPGIGGVFLNPAQDRMVVLLTDLSRSLQAQQAVQSLVLRLGGMSVAGGRARTDLPVEVRPAQYAFSELAAWSDFLFAALLGSDLPWTHVGPSEDINRVWVALSDLSAIGAVHAMAASIGIPSDALEVVQLPAPTTALAALDWRIRPARGGLQIQNNSGTGYCTYGWTVQNGSDWGFLTAGHCLSSSLGNGTTGETIHQAWKVGSNAIGTVHANGNPTWPTFITCVIDIGANPGTQFNGMCPAADVAYVSASSSDVLRTIAATTVLNDNNNLRGGYEFDTLFTPTVANTSTGGESVNTSVQKVGNVTGRTGGVVSQICKNVNFSTHVTRCANVVTGSASGRGDSGAPVWRSTGGDLIPLGILIGSNPVQTRSDGEITCQADDGGIGFGQTTCTMYYSPISQIHSHLGMTFDYRP
jgi:hypothetical protein